MRRVPLRAATRVRGTWRRAVRIGIAVVAVLTVAFPALATDRVFWNGFEPAIAAPADAWTWVDFPDAECANGSATGIGINPSTLSNHLLIYLQGGGACWDWFTCYFLGGTASHLGGYGASDFASDAADTTGLAQPGGFFDRSAAGNPFKDYSYVFVPYCTGDVHAGDNVVSLSGTTTHFVGFRNMRAFLARLAVTFPGADRIVLAGSSAGGLGATLNWWQTQEAFTAARVDMINDSGAIMPEDVLPQPNTREETIRSAWNLAATLPPGCSACATSFDVIFAFYESVFPDHRGALLSYEQDTVLPSFYGISTTAFTQGLSELEAQQFDPTLNLHYFNAAGSGHELWFSPGLTTNNVSVRDFVTLMVTDNLNWISVTP